MAERLQAERTEREDTQPGEQQQRDKAADEAHASASAPAVVGEDR
jgi:hypothetical protein